MWLWQRDTEGSEALEQVGAERPDVLVNLKIRSDGLVCNLSVQIDLNEFYHFKTAKDPSSTHALLS